MTETARAAMVPDMKLRFALLAVLTAATLTAALAPALANACSFAFLEFEWDIWDGPYDPDDETAPAALDLVVDIEAVFPKKSLFGSSSCDDTPDHTNVVLELVPPEGESFEDIGVAFELVEGEVPSSLRFLEDMANRDEPLAILGRDTETWGPIEPFSFTLALTPHDGSGNVGPTEEFEVVWEGAEAPGCAVDPQRGGPGGPLAVLGALGLLGLRRRS